MEERNLHQIDKLKKIESDAKSLMEEVIEDYPELTKKKVRRIVKMSGISEKDPLFLILLVCRITHVLVEDAPQQIAKTFDLGRVSILKLFETEKKKLLDVQEQSLQLHQQAALDLTVAKIVTMLDREFEQRGVNDPKKISPKLIGIISTATVTIISLIIGFIAGWSFEFSWLGKNNLTRLSLEDISSLNWVKTPEGKLAKNILIWNEDLADKSCQSKVKDLNVTIQIGTAKAISGYCWVWIEPPSKRKFER